MGTDIAGRIECRLRYPIDSRKPWTSAIDLSLLYHGRDYDAFGCLFGIRNYAHFRPVAAERGLPADVSREVKEDAESYGEGGSGHSWISWAEIKAIDWEEETEETDSRIHEYRRAEDGSLVYEGKSSLDPTFAKHVSYSLRAPHSWPEGQEWEIEGKIYRAEKLKRKDTREGWDSLFTVMELLAAYYEDDGVRLVVWFY
ncbi:MAG: hypothetical protein ABI456_14315 [Ktedonobacteraceae bacterium]|nr:hypothetical protein [Chloroflexota bacterium]